MRVSRVCWGDRGISPAAAVRLVGLPVWPGLAPPSPGAGLLGPWSKRYRSCRVAGSALLPARFRRHGPTSPSGRRLLPVSRAPGVIFGSVTIPHIAAQAVNRSLWVAVTVRNPDPEGF